MSEDIVYKATQNFDKYIYDLLVNAKEQGYTIDDLISIYDKLKTEGWRDNNGTDTADT